MGETMDDNPPPKRTLFGIEPTIDFATGRGLDKAGLAVWHDQLALLFFTEALASEPGFWHQVDHVRATLDPLREARPYGTGPRRELVAHLMLVAALPSTRKQSEHALRGAGVRGHFVSEDPPNERGTYALRADYRGLLAEGAAAAARRGLGQCLRCGAALRTTSRTKGGVVARLERVDTCDEHESASDYLDGRLRRFYRHALAAVPGDLSEHVQLGIEDLRDRVAA